MSDREYTDWLDRLARKAQVQNLLFLQLGAAHAPARRALAASPFSCVSVTAFVQEDSDPPGAVIVIDGIEVLATSKSEREVTFGILRDRVFGSLARGKRCILLSRSPRAAFPAVPGSSLLDDASFVHGPRDDMSEVSRWPSCRLDGEAPESVLRAALSDLGPEVCAALDRAIFDCLLTGEAAIGVLSAREVEAIGAAGLISSTSGGGCCWNFQQHLNPLKSALADVLADAVLPQEQLSAVNHGLWQIERMIRRAVRQKAVGAWGDKWRQQCLQGELPRKVLERATEAAYPAANSIKLLRDPLEWLTLGELLDLKGRTEIGDLGIPSVLWRNFSADIMPIRNRLAHMRTLHPGDSAEVVKWLRALEVKLPR